MTKKASYGEVMIQKPLLPWTRLPGSVLFACGSNTIRSPMAEALLKHLLGAHIFVDSVGVRAGTPDGFAIAVMEEMGLDISRHTPKSFTDIEEGAFDIIISMSPEAQHAAVELTRTQAAALEFWPILDPSLTEGSRERRLEAYRAVRDVIWARIKRSFPLQPKP